MSRTGRALGLALAALLCFGTGFPLFRGRSAAVEEGNRLLAAGKPAEALAAYDRAAQALAAEPGLHFDRGAALYALGRFPEAQQEFLRATEAREGKLKSQGFYNMGNAFFRQEKYREAADAYRRSLGIDPGELRTKWNLELALRRLREQEEKQRQEEQRDRAQGEPSPQPQGGASEPPPEEGERSEADKRREEEERKRREEEERKKREEEERKRREEEAARQGQPKDEGQPAPKPTQPEARPEERPLGKEEAEAVLDALEQKERTAEQERARIRSKRRRPERDW